MARYIARRLLAAIPVLAVVGIVAFVLIHLAPGDPAAAIAGDAATPESIDRLHSRLGLGGSIPSQFAGWVAGIARGDFGTSLFTGQPLPEALAQRLPATLSLALLGELVAVGLGLPLGIVAAQARNSLADRVVMLFAVFGFATPAFLLGYILILLFALRLTWLPPTGYEPPSSGPWEFLRFMILPALTLGLGNAALIARLTRATMLEVLDQDYVRTARAKGLRRRSVLINHAARNAAIPVVTVVGLTLANAMAGTAVVETVFSIPGMGRFVVQSAINRDYPILQGTVLLTGVLFVAVNLVVDLSYALLDPRTRA